jgi:hypothetical protein
MEGRRIFFGRMRRKLRMLAVKVVKLGMATARVVNLGIMTLEVMKLGTVKTVIPTGETEQRLETS